MKRGGLVLFITILTSLAFAQKAYFIQADMVRGAEGAQGNVCVPNSVFVPGEMIVFRAIVYDAVTGEELKLDQIQERGITATVKIDNGMDLVMFYPPPGGDVPPGAEYFRGTWAIPTDEATGMYNWNIEVTDAAGNSVTFTPIGAAIGANSITIQAAAQ